MLNEIADVKLHGLSYIDTTRMANLLGIDNKQNKTAIILLSEPMITRFTDDCMYHHFRMIQLPETFISRCRVYVIITENASFFPLWWSL